MFKILDRYIIRKFLGTYVFSIVLLLAIVVMFDVNEKLDSFIKAPLKATIFDYFLNFLPYFANQFSPLFTFIAVIFFTSKLAGNSEIIAMLSTGMSFKRLLRPYLMSAAIIAALTFVLSAYVIPPANVKRINYQNTYVKNKRVDYGQNIMLMVSPGQIAYMNRYDNLSKTGYRFSLDQFDENKKLTSRLTASSIKWDTLYQWTVYDYVVRDFRDNREFIDKGTRRDTSLAFEPRDFLISSNDQEQMTSPALDEYIRRQKQRGVGNIQMFEVERERRYAMTAAAFILTIIGMTLSVKKQKGGMGLNIGIGLVLSFSYILFMTITQTFAISGLTSPFVAMWIPNLIYSVIAVVLYRRAAKRQEIMYRIIEKTHFSEHVVKLLVEAPEVARARKPGHFVIVRCGEHGERIPLTIADADVKAGTITLVIQAVGDSTRKICALEAGDSLHDVVGPLGRPTAIQRHEGTVLCCGGGVGVAPLLPIIKAFKEAGNRVVSVLAARNKDLIILEKEVAAYSDEVIIMTDDGSAGRKGLVTAGAEEVILRENVSECVAIGPAIMMKFVALLTQKYNVPTICSLNTIMVDGTGMCGACRVTVGGKQRFVCVDGPEFDAHQVDFDEMMSRMRAYDSVRNTKASK